MPGIHAGTEMCGSALAQWLLWCHTSTSSVIQRVSAALYRPRCEKHIKTWSSWLKQNLLQCLLTWKTVWRQDFSLRSLWHCFTEAFILKAGHICDKICHVYLKSQHKNHPYCRTVCMPFAAAWWIYCAAMSDSEYSADLYSATRVQDKKS